MSDDIGSGLSSMAVCFDFHSTNIVQLSNWNPYFYRFRCHHPLITQLNANLVLYNLIGRDRCQLGICGTSFLEGPGQYLRTVLLSITFNNLPWRQALREGRFDQIGECFVLIFTGFIFSLVLPYLATFKGQEISEWNCGVFNFPKN